MKVLVADTLELSGLDGLRAAGCEVLYQPDLTADALGPACASTGADVLIVRSTRVTAETLDAGALSLVVRAGAGVNTIDVTAAARRGIYVSNCPGKNAIAVAELTFGLLLALDRRIPDNVTDLRQGRWNKSQYSKAAGLFGRTIGLLGLGAVGQEVARRAVGFGMTVVAWSPRFVRPREGAPPALPPDLTVTIEASPEAVARRCDALSLHLALAPETRGLVGAGLLAQLRPGALLINTARAELVDEEALLQAVRANGLRAAVDVFRDEPVEGSARFFPPLAADAQVYATHHIGASTAQAQEAIAAETVRIVRVYRETGAVPNAVNLATRTAASHTLVVRHLDRPGVLAHVFTQLRRFNLNVQETDNVIFEGAEAAVARINLDGEPDRRVLKAISESGDVLSVHVVEI